jgi:hypothetical protein
MPNWNAVFKSDLALIRAGYPDGVLHIYGAILLKSVAAQ